MLLYIPYVINIGFKIKSILAVMAVAMFYSENNLNAQDSIKYEGINSDRPGQSFSAINLDKGQLSLQSGVLVPFSGYFESKYTISSFVRYGLLKRLELGFGTGYARNNPLSGYKSDLFLYLPTASVRGQLLFEKKYVPAAGLHFDFTNQVRYVKTVNDRNETYKIDTYLLRLSLSKMLNKNFSVAVNVSREIFDDGYVEVPINYTFNVGYSHFNYGTFLEFYGNNQKKYVLGVEPDFTGRSNNHKERRLLNFDTGFWYQITEKTRIDFTFGLNDGGYLKRFDNAQYFAEMGATILLR